MTPSGPKTKLPATSLYGCRFDLGDGLVLELRRPTYPELLAVDATWPALRAADAQHAHWLWSAFAGQANERFGLFAGDQCVALWSSLAPRLLRLSPYHCYQLDALEVRADLRGAGIGQLATGLVALRAGEVGAQAVVLCALGQASGFYERLGGIAGPIAGWPQRPELLPYYFGPASLQQRVADAESLRAND